MRLSEEPTETGVLLFYCGYKDSTLNYSCERNEMIRISTGGLSWRDSTSKLDNPPYRAYGIAVSTERQQQIFA